MGKGWDSESIGYAPVLINQGDGNFSVEPPIDVGLDPVSIDAADLNGNGAPNPGEPFAVTMTDDPLTTEDESGRYWLVDLPALVFIEVRELVPAGFVQTWPVHGAAGFTLAPGEVRTGIDFGNAPALYHYILERMPSTRYYHVSTAIRADTQEHLLLQLARGGQIAHVVERRGQVRPRIQHGGMVIGQRAGSDLEHLLLEFQRGGPFAQMSEDGRQGLPGRLQVRVVVRQVAGPDLEHLLLEFRLPGAGASTGRARGAGVLPDLVWEARAPGDGTGVDVRSARISVPDISETGGVKLVASSDLLVPHATVPERQIATRRSV